MKYCIITGQELRHRFFYSELKKFFGDAVFGFGESIDGTLASRAVGQGEAMISHVRMRTACEETVFGSQVKNQKDFVEIPRGYINTLEFRRTVIGLDAGTIICFGCSLLSKEFISDFPGRILNLHLGLSPYYRGTGTNFWPWVYDELQFVGASFLALDAGIDSGPIIHQVRPKFEVEDDIHSVGCRLLASLPLTMKSILSLDNLTTAHPSIFSSSPRRLKLKKDFTSDALQIAHRNIESGIVQRYIKYRQEDCHIAYPIYTQDGIE